MDPVSRFAAGPEWFDMMSRGGKPPAVVVIVRDGRTLKGVLPLLPRTWHKGFRVLRAGGGDLIAGNLNAAELHDVLGRVLARYGDMDAIWFDHVGDEDRFALLEAACRTGKNAFMHVIHSKLPHYRFQLPATLEQCLSARLAKTRKKIDARERALVRDTGSECRIVEIRKSADWARYADALEDMMNNTWQARALGHTFRVNDTVHVSEKGWLRSFLLMAGNEPAAFVLGYQGFGTFIYEKIGFDRAFARYSPGTILLYRLLARLYESDTPRYVDFGVGEADYKAHLGNDVIHAGSVMLVRRTLTLRIRFGLIRTRAAMCVAARRTSRILGISGKLRTLRRRR